MLELRYTPSSGQGSQLGSITQLQSVLYAVCNVLLPYIASKLNDWHTQRGVATAYPLVSILDLVPMKEVYKGWLHHTH